VAPLFQYDFALHCATRQLFCRIIYVQQSQFLLATIMSLRSLFICTMH